MKTSANGRAFIEAFEGKFNHAYDDGTGVLTVGYGHTDAAGLPKVTRGMCITDAECDQVLSDDLGKVEKSVSGCIKPPLAQWQFDALVSFEFNTGDLAKSSIPEHINEGRPEAAMATLLQYDHAGGRVMAGLTRRRKAERIMFEGQINAAMRLAGAHATTPDTPKMPQAPTKSPVTPVPAQPKPDVTPPTGFWSLLASIVRTILSIFSKGK